MNGFLTWQALATFSGAAAATGMFTQFIKGMFPKLPTQILSYLVSLAILAVALLAAGGAAWQDFAVLPLNAALVSLSSNGAHTAIKRASAGSGDGGN